MSISFRKQATLRGEMTFIGNTLGLAKHPNQNNIGTEHSIGAFTTLNTALKVNDYYNGTTLDYTSNSSSAILTLPENASIYYAELIWGGTCRTSGGTLPMLNIPTNTLTQPITFITPDHVPHLITRDLDTFFRGTGSNRNEYYTCTANVTDLVALFTAKENLYTVGKVPGIADPFESRSGATCFAGWTLAVIYELPTAPLRNFSLSVGGAIVNGNSTAVDVDVTGFITPKIGSFDSRILLSTGEGDSALGGDTAIFAPRRELLDSDHLLSGPNNPKENFFCSQINDNEGNLKTTGTFGLFNNDMSTTPATLIEGARQGWDITNVKSSDFMEPNQSSAVLRLTTNQDTFIPNAIGIQTDMADVNLSIEKSSEQAGQYLPIGSKVTYKIHVVNNDTELDATNLKIVDPLTSGLKLIPGTVIINDGPPETIDITTQPGVQYETLAPGSEIEITFQAEIVASPAPNSDYTNMANVTYTFNPATGISPTTTRYSNPVSINPFTDLTTFEKTVVPEGPVVPGMSLDYTLSFTNNSNITIDTLTLVDIISDKVEVIDGTATTTRIEVVFEDVAPNETKTYSYTARVKENSSGIIRNDATATYQYANGYENELRDHIETPILVPRFDVTKTQSMNYVDEDDTVTYTLLLKNSGNVPLFNFVLTDVLPTGLTYKENSFTVNDVPFTEEVDFANPINLGDSYTLPAQNSTLKITFEVVVDDITKAPFYNKATILADYAITEEEVKTISSYSNEVVLRHTIHPVTVTKSADRHMVSAFGGESVTYTINIRSNGNASEFQLSEEWPTANDGTVMNYEADSLVIVPSLTAPDSLELTLVDDEPTGFEANIKQLTSSSNYTITFKMTAPDLNDGESARVFDNTAYYGYQYAKDPNKPTDLTEVSTNTMPLVLVKQAPVSLAFTKQIYLQGTATPITSAFVGEVVTTTLNFTNTSGDSLYFNSISDLYILPDQFELGTVTVDGLEDSSYTINAPTIENNYILSVSCNTPQLIANGESVTVTFNATVLSGAANYTTDYGQLDFGTSNGDTQIVNTTTHKLDIAHPVIEVQKHADTTQTQVGDNYHYDIIVTNNGNITLTNVYLNDTALNNYINGDPAHLTLSRPITIDGRPIDSTDLTNIVLPVLEKSQSVVIQIPVEVNSPPDHYRFDNTADAYGTATLVRANIDAALNSVEVSDSADEVVDCLYVSVDTSKTADRQYALNGQTISYTIIVTNRSNITIENAIVQDKLPPELLVNEDSITPAGNLEYGINVGPLAPGQKKYVTYDAQVKIPEGTIQTVSNCAQTNYSFSAYGSHTHCGVSNESCGSISVYSPSLSVEKTPEQLDVLLNTNVDYKITVTNTGEITLNNLALSDLLPIGITQDPDNKQIIVEKGDTMTMIPADLSTDDFFSLQTGLTPNESLTITIPVSVTRNPFYYASDNCYKNKATIRYSYDILNDLDRIIATYTDTKQSNESSLCLAAPNIIATKSAYPTVANYNSEILYTILIANRGNVDVSNLALVDPLPPGLEYVYPFTLVDGVAYPSTLEDGITIRQIPAQSVVMVTYVATVKDISKQPFRNQGKFHYQYQLNGETYTSDEQWTTPATVTVPDAEIGEMKITKSVSDTNVRIGDYVTFTLKVENTGETNLTDIKITDTLPTGLTFVPHSVTVDGSPTTYDITSETGVPVDTLYPVSTHEKNISIITFRAKVDSLPETSYTNIATGCFTALKTSGPETSCVDSNPVSITGAKISLNKTVDKKKAFENTTLYYTITIQNESAATLYKVLLTDEIDTNVAVDYNSILLNGNPIHDFPNVNIGTLQPAGQQGASAILTFQATVLPNTAGCAIVNHASVTALTADYKTVYDSDTTLTCVIKICPECPKYPECPEYPECSECKKCKECKECKGCKDHSKHSGQCKGPKKPGPHH